MRKSSTGSRASFSTTRCQMTSACTSLSPMARPNVNGSTPCSWRMLIAFSPSLRVVSDLNSCAPPYTVCTGWRSPALPGKRFMNGSSARSSGPVNGLKSSIVVFNSMLPDDVRRAPADERQHRQHDPVVLAAVGRDREVVADHDQHHREHHIGVVFRAELRALGEARIGLAAGVHIRDHLPLSGKNA